MGAWAVGISLQGTEAALQNNLVSSVAHTDAHHSSNVCTTPQMQNSRNLCGPVAFRVHTTWNGSMHSHPEAVDVASTHLLVCPPRLQLCGLAKHSSRPCSYHHHPCFRCWLVLPSCPHSCHCLRCWLVLPSCSAFESTCGAGVKAGSPVQSQPLPSTPHYHVAEHCHPILQLPSLAVLPYAYC